MFDVAVICYLFLGGLSGGLCVVAAASALSIPVSYLRAGLALEQRRLLGASFVACAGGLLLSALFLMADAGNVAALKYLVLTPNPGYLVLGAWSIAAGILLSLALAIRWRSPEPARGVLFMRALLVLEALIGAVVVVYTGLFLASMFAVPLWNTPWLVALFAASASSCALSAFVALCNALGLSAAFSAWMRRLVQLDGAILLIEAVCAVGFVFVALQTDTGSAVVAQASAARLLSGDLSAAWWVGFALLGIAVPLAFDLALLRSQRTLAPYSLKALAPALFAFVGGFCLRYCVVMAGMHPVVGF